MILLLRSPQGMTYCVPDLETCIPWPSCVCVCVGGGQSYYIKGRKKPNKEMDYKGVSQHTQGFP